MWRFALPVRVVFGTSALESLGQEAKRFGQNAYLVAARESMKRTGILGRAVKSLKDAGLYVEVFDEADPNPTSVGVDELANKIRKVNHLPNVVVGLGGGSAIDFAKALAVALAVDGPIWDYVIRGNYTPKKAPKSSLPIIAVPTTAGTGTEVTAWSVLTNPETGEKPAIYDAAVLPKVAIVDPDLALRLTPRLTASTGIDALSHAIEAFTGAIASPFSDLVSLEAIRLVGKSLEKAVKTGQDKQARADMAWAATLAGIAIEHGGTHLVHNMAHAMGGVLDAPHGEAIALCLPVVMELCLKGAEQNFIQIAQALSRDARTVKSPEDSVREVKDLFARIGFEVTTLGDLGADAATIEKLLDHNFGELAPLFDRCPVSVTRESVRELYTTLL